MLGWKEAEEEEAEKEEAEEEEDGGRVKKGRM